MIVSLSRGRVGEVGGRGEKRNLVNWTFDCCEKRLACMRAVREWLAAVAALSIEDVAR